MTEPWRNRSEPRNAGEYFLQATHHATQPNVAPRLPKAKRRKKGLEGKFRRGGFLCFLLKVQRTWCSTHWRLSYWVLRQVIMLHRRICHRRCRDLIGRSSEKDCYKRGETWSGCPFCRARGARKTHEFRSTVCREPPLDCTW